jgi:hypothetical protein
VVTPVVMRIRALEQSAGDVLRVERDRTGSGRAQLGSGAGGDLMIEFRLLWKEKIPGLLAMQTFAGRVTTDFTAVREEYLARFAAPGCYSPFIELREASADPWPAPGEGSIPPFR